MHPVNPALTALRIDKWLWAARFFKTRSLAAQAIHAGHVRLNGTADKAAREVLPGDTLEITLSEERWTVTVLAINEQRRPAPEARALYAETPESTARREAQREARHFAPNPGSDLRGRPTKRDRRQIRGFNESF